MRMKILAVALIGLLMSMGLVLVGCDIKQCPDGINCTADFTGTGVGSSSPIIHSITSCSSSDCNVNGTFNASSGYRTTINCRGCKI